MKNQWAPLLVFCVFLAIGITLWLTQNHVFYLLNFTYIGGFVSLGMFLMARKKPYARLVAQAGVGLYMFVFLGIMLGENMQIEGFWYYLFSGVFQAAVIHYLVAKIAGPLLFARGWCGYACWTAAVLDLLPFKLPAGKRKEKWGVIRLLVFLLSLAFVGSLFAFKVQNIEAIMFVAFIAGNMAYFAVGILLAFALKDNRAFCKYVCPITVFLKPMSYFSITRIKVEQNKCIHCGQCEKVCPMDVAVLDNRRARKNGTECILCMNCINKCPTGAVKL